MGEFKSLLRKISDDYHGPRSLPLVRKFGEVSYAPQGGTQDPKPRKHSLSAPEILGHRAAHANPSGEEKTDIDSVFQ